MAHHYSGPDFSFPHGDPRVDHTDLFAFPAPEGTGRSVLVIDVHPSVGINPPGPTTVEPFAPEAVYELKVDTNGDGVADVAFRTQVSATDGTQSATVRRVEGAEAAGMGDSGDVVVENAPVSTGSDARVTESGEYRLFAGWRSDPFFFDAEGVLNDFQFTGNDFFADKDVCSIVLELPNDALGASGGAALWHRIIVPGGSGNGEWVQADRGARPSQSVFFSPGDEKEAYLTGEPATDARFVDSFAHVLEHAGGYASGEARRVAETLLPDVLPYDPAQPAGYPRNGRALTDDVADYFLALFTNGKVTDDGLGPHTDLLNEFPYVGAPHASYGPT
jgi:Domain of unknown function (DUF4331)